jgi:hypothetical protein
MKAYQIHLDKTIIGTTLFEKADPPMGVVFGAIQFSFKESPYDYFLSYCKRNNVDSANYPEDKIISTRIIPGLVVIDETGKEIKSDGCYIEGMDKEGFEIIISGIPYPLYLPFV